MHRRTVFRATVAAGDPLAGAIRCRATAHRHRPNYALALGLALAFAGLLGAATPGAAQQGDVSRRLPPGTDLDFRLAVRPRAMATATHNPAAGDFPLDSVYEVVVPPQCVGARRCPLLIGAPTIGDRTMYKTIARYGIILMVGETSSKHQIAASLTQVLRRFAIDPDKIAILGRCGAAPYAMEFAFQNPEVFSRVVGASGPVSLPPGLGRATRRVELLIANGIDDWGISHFGTIYRLRQQGHRAELEVGFRGHENQLEEYDFIGHWLQQSWAIPNPAARPAPEVIDSLPVLTSMGVQRLTMFWNLFLQEPDSVKTLARRAHLRAVALPLGRARAVVWMTDMTALAAKYPSVAAKLKQARLTPRQHDAYRLALFSALALTRGGRIPMTPVDNQQWLELAQAATAVPDAQKTSEDSVLAKQRDMAVDQLRSWEQRNQEAPDVGAAGTMLLQARNASWVEAQPELLDSLKATGIWRTP